MMLVGTFPFSYTPVFLNTYPAVICSIVTNVVCFFHNMFACILKVVSVIREQSSHHSCVQTERTKQQQKRTGKVPKTDQSSKRRR